MGLSNHLPDTPWPKVERGKLWMSALMKANEGGLVGGLFDALSDRAVAPDAELPNTGVGRLRERELSCSFVAGERYGTRASTVLLVGRDGQVVCVERRFGPRGRAPGRSGAPLRASHARERAEHEGGGPGRLICRLALHGDVRDARLHEFLALADEAALPVEGDDAGLGMQPHFVVAHLVGDDEQEIEQRPPNALFAPLRKHSNATDAAIRQQPTGTDRRALRGIGENVIGTFVEAVPLERRGNALLLDENLVANRLDVLLGSLPVDRFDGE